MSTRAWIVPAVLLAALLQSACADSSTDDDVAPWPAGDTTYNFTLPDESFTLVDALDEISGLTLMDDGRLAAIEDEQGDLYVLDPASGAVVETRSFGGRGDYEALALAGSRLFVLQSNGSLHRFDEWSTPEFTGETFELDIPMNCDAEGMTYDADEDRLLVACKDEPGPNLEREKAIYAFDLNGRKLSEQPVYIVDSRAFTASLADHPVNEAVRAVLSDRVDFSGFRPSGLAVHPISGEIYILSSIRESLVSIDRDGTVTGIWPLLDKLLEQPEGLIFLPNGDLFIASEKGDRKNAVLLRFNYRGHDTTSQE